MEREARKAIGAVRHGMTESFSTWIPVHLHPAGIGLLNSIIADHHIVDLTYLNIELQGLTEKNRKAFIDVLNFNIAEVASLKPVPDTYIRKYTSREVQTQEKLPASSEYYFIELKKFKKSLSELANDMEKWLYLLVKAGLLREIPECFDDQEPFRAFFEASETAAFTNEESIRYTEDMLTEWDINCALEDHEAKGREEGKSLALKDTARKMLEQGIPVDIVIKCTGLPEDVITSLQ